MSFKAIFEKCSAGQIPRNSRFHHNELFLSIFAYFLHNKVYNKNLCTFATINRLVPINITKFQNKDDCDMKNYKIHVYILHASGYRSA